MADLVPANDIETIVGASRHPLAHIGRAVSAEQRVYILHSEACADSGIDLRACIYSKALDRGITPSEWIEDTALALQIENGWLLPDGPAPAITETAEDGCTHDWMLRPESDTWQCLICGDER